MIREYLSSLKEKGGYSWSELSQMTGIPDGTIRKIFDGTTEDPRFASVAKLVGVMGGSLSALADAESNKEPAKEKETITEKEEEDRISMNNAIIALRELYESKIEDLKTSHAERIADLKTGNAERISDLKTSKKWITVVAAVLGMFLLTFLTVDIFIGSIGWIRY